MTAQRRTPDQRELTIEFAVGDSELSYDDKLEAYRRLADESGVPAYKRVPTVGTHPKFIAGLADRVRAVLSGPPVAVCHGATTMPCGQQHRGCPLIAGAM